MVVNITSVGLTDEHAVWIDEECINFSKFVRRAIDKEMEKSANELKKHEFEYIQTDYETYLEYIDKDPKFINVLMEDGAI